MSVLLCTGEEALGNLACVTVLVSGRPARSRTLSRSSGGRTGHRQHWVLLGAAIPLPVRGHDSNVVLTSMEGFSMKLFLDRYTCSELSLGEFELHTHTDPLCICFTANCIAFSINILLNTFV